MQFEELNYQGSRLFLYYNERKLDGDIDQDGGSTITTAIKALKKFGLCQEKDWPYDETKFKICPPKTCYDAALQNKVINAHIVSADALKQTLASGFPIAFGTILFSSFESDEVAKTGIIPMPTDDENSVGGHAMCIVGFDDDKKVFIVRNSWGTSWGLAGYCYFPYEYFADDENLASDYWVITNISHPAFKLAKKMYD
jgi:C1A family cysteine protease